MHLSPRELEVYKQELIREYVWPAFGGQVSLDKEKFEEVARRFHLQKAVKQQRLESPGESFKGHLWFSINAMCHSYFYNEDKHRESGTAIYRKREFIFNGDSLLYGEDRPDYVQVLETTEMLYIGYPDVLDLIMRYADINQAIRSLSAQQGIYFRRRNTLLNLPSLERVSLFRKENPLFISSSTQEMQAIHVNLSLRAYTDALRKL